MKNQSGSAPYRQLGVILVSMVLGAMGSTAGCGDGESAGDAGVVDSGDEGGAPEGGRIDAGPDAGDGGDAADAGMDAGDGGEADGGDGMDGGDGLDGGDGGDGGDVDAGPTLTEAGDAFITACYAECDKFELCAPDAWGPGECQALCDTDRYNRDQDVAEGRPVDEVIACFQAKQDESECLVSQTCDGFIEHYTRPDSADYPCRTEELHMESVCAPS